MQVTDQISMDLLVQLVLLSARQSRAICLGFILTDSARAHAGAVQSARFFPHLAGKQGGWNCGPEGLLRDSEQENRCGR